MNKIFYLASAMVFLLVSACSFVGSDPSEGSVDNTLTLADLNPAVIPDRSKALPQIEFDDLVETYRDVLTVTEDAETRLKVLHRLAGLEMKRGEEALYQDVSSANEAPFGLAIDAYLSLLDSNPDHPDNDALLYQLSKAYDLGGRIEESMAVLSELVVDFPSSRHYIEAQFRRAEIFFSESEYRDASLAYLEVVNNGQESSYYQNALYMYGWSLFKQERYRASIKPFSDVLDINVPADNQLQALERGPVRTDSRRIQGVKYCIFLSRWP